METIGSNKVKERLLSKIDQISTLITNKEYNQLENPIFQGQTRIDKNGQYRMYWEDNGKFYYTVNTLKL
jgi:hypothetical protein